MTILPPDLSADHHRIVRGGPAYRVARALGLAQPGPWRRALKVALLVLITWVPLVVLSWLQGHALGSAVNIPLLYDPVVYSRFLFVVPLLELADIAVATGLVVQVAYFLSSGLVPTRELPRFEAVRAETVRWRDSAVVEAGLAVLAVLIAFLAQKAALQNETQTSWKWMASGITLAGWWYILVSLPILFFFLLRWAWVLALWGWFLARVARLDLALTPTHADRAGGLGFLGWGLSSFSAVLMAVSAVISGGFASEIIHKGGSLHDLKYHVVIFVVIAVGVLHAPLLAFVGKLSECRWRGLLEYAALCSRHDLAFAAKWLGPRDHNRNSNGDSADAPASPLLGSADVSTLADVAAAYDRVERMQVIPFDKYGVIALAAAALLPMVPLLGTAIPIQDILTKLAALML